MIKSSQGLTCTTSIPLTGPVAAGNTPHPLLLEQRRHLSLSGGDGKAKARAAPGLIARDTSVLPSDEYSAESPSGSANDNYLHPPDSDLLLLTI
ncbi:uncharacterized [Tachysurus ichikawai]